MDDRRLYWIALLSPALSAAGCAAATPDEGPTATARAALTVMEDQRLAEPAPEALRLFGFAVAGSGSTVLIGAPGEAGMTRGAVHVYTVAGGVATFATTLEPGDGEDGMRFGRQVAIDGDTAVVMAGADYEASSIEERIYVFGRGDEGWSEQALLTIPEVITGGLSTMAVDVDGDTVVASDVCEDGDVALGRAFAFTRAGGAWSPRVELVPHDSPRGLGWSVALSGDTAILGAPQDDPEGRYSAGSAYVFVREGGAWTQQAKLVPPDSGVNLAFGTSVSVEGDTAAIGAKSAVYIYARHDGVWTQQAKLTPALTGSAATGVQLLRNAVLAGFVGVNDQKGVASVFHGGGATWVEARTLVPSDGHAFDFFGLSTGYAGGSAIVGAPYLGESPSRAGAAYVYALPSLDGGSCAADEDCLSGTCLAGECAPGGGSGAGAGGGGSGAGAGGGDSATGAGGSGAGGGATGSGGDSTAGAGGGVTGSGGDSTAGAGGGATGSGGDSTAGAGGGATGSGGDSTAGAGGAGGDSTAGAGGGDSAGGGVSAGGGDSTAGAGGGGDSTASAGGGATGSGGDSTAGAGGGGCQMGSPDRPAQRAPAIAVVLFALAAVSARRTRGWIAWVPS
ncbi:FG-GAP repeat protein [Sorangium sp. So ce406]|uniref:FG-GAP repeat protein n=1 Tax=Sorangium sp. So ce406 TaxID=3133311 RepID=UPI003F5B0901